MGLIGITLAIAVFLASSSPVLSENILIKGGTVVNADRAFKADVVVKGGLIEAVGPGLKAPKGAKVVDATGKYVMPGGIDPHTHLEFPFMGQVSNETFLSGERAALAGGTTFHIDFALQWEGSLKKGLAEWKRKAQRAISDYGFHMAINKWTSETAAEMAEMVREGINSFKFFMAYKGALMVSDELFLDGLLACKKLGALPMVHGENGDAIALAQKLTIEKGITGPEGHSISRPSYLEGEATGRAVKLARLLNVPLYVVHVMSKDAIEAIEEGHRAGQRLWGEAVAGAISLTDEPCWDPDFKIAAAHVISPPLRSREHQTAVKAALAGGSLQLIGTDHCGWNTTQKAVGRHDFRILPNGIHGIEERLHTAWEDLVNAGLITPPDFVRLTSAEAAKIFNLYPQKGVIAAGSDADIIVLDPSVTHKISVATHHSSLDMNVFEGKTVHGKVTTTISRGRLAWDGKDILLEPGSGRYVRMEPFAPHVYGGLDEQEKRWIGERFPYGPAPVKRVGDKPPRDEL
ncbi:hypothetical protein WJX72_003386 [[Myrmecia] bisecta]|uniref:dihydropyrimidinase n=1 Tax=[Myrmecia] bisecta TaxID=41462 RepID=A0AAW1Q3N6_9CHLO